ncbi:MAG: hypothetical protein ACRD12_19480 [Acidimicrobiales bacterium]
MSRGVRHPKTIAATALTVLVAGWMITTATATARAAAAAATLEVEAGYAGTYIPGQPVPVRVRVTADRLLSAPLEVTLNGPPTAVRIEVPGGTTKDFLIVMPMSAGATRATTVTARLPDGSRTPPAATASLVPIGDEEVVGLFPGALGGRAAPGPAPLAVDVGTARFVALGPLEIDRVPDSLAALATIGVGGDELARMAPSVRAGLLRWVEAGGRLLVDAPPGSPVPGLPDDWQPGDERRAGAGAGEVRLTAGAMAGGRWAGLVEPTRRPSNEDFFFGGGPPLGGVLAGEAGFRVPRFSWLVGFLVLYVAVVGPVLYLVLRRRRRPELGWVAIPVIALLFTTASYAGGRNLRPSAPLVHGTILSTGAHGSTAITFVGVSSRSGGTARLAYPPGWLAGGGAEAGVDLASMTEVNTTGSGGPEGRVPLDAGQFAVVSGRGPAGVQGQLEVHASSDADGVVTGTVRNGTPFDLDGLALLVGNSGTRLGPLAAGQMQEWTVNGAGIPLGGQPPVEFTIWGRPAMTESSQRDMLTSLALWNAARRAGVPTPDRGQPVAVGWTRQYELPVTSGDSDARPRGQTLVLGTGPVIVRGPRATDVSVQTQVVRSSAPRGGTVVRFGLPDVDHTIDPAKLILRTTMSAAEVWNGEAWAALPCSGPTCQPVPAPGVRCLPNAPCPAPVRGPGMMVGPLVELPIPPGAVRDGAVYVRFPGGFGGLPTSDTAFGLREIA